MRMQMICARSIDIICCLYLISDRLFHFNRGTEYGSKPYKTLLEEKFKINGKLQLTIIYAIALVQDDISKGVSVSKVIQNRRHNILLTYPFCYFSQCRLQRVWSGQEHFLSLWDGLAEAHSYDHCMEVRVRLRRRSVERVLCMEAYIC